LHGARASEGRNPGSWEAALLEPALILVVSINKPDGQIGSHLHLLTTHRAGFLKSPDTLGESEAAMKLRPQSEAGFRALLALVIVAFSILGASVASWVAIVNASGAQGKAEAARLVFASVLPLFGTWVGTVLAFYYARDNLQAATDSTIRLAARSDPSTPVDQVMIPLSRIDGTTAPKGQLAEELLLRDIASRMASAGRQRWPIFETSGTIACVVHQSTLDAYTKTLQAGALTSETLADLSADPLQGPLIMALGFVGLRDQVDRARVAMRSVPNCNDVFVTSTGDKAGTVIGWITNTLLAGHD
jgi:hypothetical protein